MHDDQLVDMRSQHSLAFHKTCFLAKYSICFLNIDLSSYQTVENIKLPVGRDSVFKAALRSREAFIMSETLSGGVWWCLSGGVLALFKPCDWSTRFIKVILLVLSLVRILHLGQAGARIRVYSVQVYCCTKHLYSRITVPSKVRAPQVSMKTL